MGQDLPVACVVNRIEKAAPDPIRIKHLTGSSKESPCEFKIVVQLAFGNTNQQNLKDLRKGYIIERGNFHI